MTITDEAVATWAASVPGDDLLALLRLCARVAEVLEHERLLAPRRIVLIDAVDAQGGLLEETFLDAGGDFEIAFRASGLRTSDEIEVHGAGVVLEPGGPASQVADLVVVEGVLTSRLSIRITTYSDAWMPRRLRGEPQPERYELNAPRLERGLTRVARELGLPLVGVDGKLAQINGFRVANLASVARVTRTEEAG